MNGSNGIDYSVGGIFDQPSTPRKKTKELPLIPETDANHSNVDATCGIEEVLPENLLFMPGRLYFSRETDHRLRYTEERRPILQPSHIEVPSNEHLIWGTTIKASGTGGGGPRLGPQEESEKRLAPATSPPVGKMRIFVSDGAAILVIPRPEMKYVAVADVQDAVIGWMEGDHGGPGFGPARADVLQEEDVVWKWRGLLQQGERLDVWELQL